MSLRSSVVIGVGAEMRGDDALGISVVEALKGRGDTPDEVELLVLDGEPARLIEASCGRSLVVIVDAVRAGSAPGTIHRFEYPFDGAAGMGRSVSTHGGGVAEALSLAEELDRLPDRLVVFGVEMDHFELGRGMSRPVRDAIPEVTRRVLAEVSS